MAQITPTPASSKDSIGPFDVNVTTLGSSDTLSFSSAKKQVLLLINQTAGSLTVTIDGDAGSTVAIQGLGTVNVAAGTQITVAAGAVRAVYLNSISHYCKGNVVLTGASGLKAAIMEL